MKNVEVFECVICYEPCTEKLACGHAFHMQCMVNWLSRKNDCPMCRKQVIPIKQLKVGNIHDETNRLVEHMEPHGIMNLFRNVLMRIGIELRGPDD